MMRNTERFSNRVDNYIRYRPHYPQDIIPFLRDNVGLEPNKIIADIGSGTGISAELFLQNGNTVYAVEPNKEMRLAAEKIYQSNLHFISVDASAEATTLPDNSIDIIIAGQAFHWFDKLLTKRELSRIATPGAFLILMWNIRSIDSPFQKAYEQLLDDYGTDYDQVKSEIDEAALQAFFAPFAYKLHSFVNTQSFDYDGLKGRLLSCSYAPLEDHASYRPMLDRLKQLFEQYNIEGKITFTYNCNLYYGKL